MLEKDAVMSQGVEPWLRGTRQDMPAVVRAVQHALDLTREDFDRWVWPLEEGSVEEQPFGLPSVGFQARHIVRSLDRLLTYAEGGALTAEQIALLAAEHQMRSKEATQTEFLHGLEVAQRRIAQLPRGSMDDARHVGRAALPVTLGGLVVHLAEHTQRHSGQAVTTAKLILALRAAEQS